MVKISKRLLISVITLAFFMQSVDSALPLPSSGRDTLRPASLALSLKKPAVRVVYLNGSGKLEEEQLKQVELPKDEEVLIRIVPKTKEEKEELKALGLKPLWDKENITSNIRNIFQGGQVESIGEALPVRGDAKRATITIKFKKEQPFDDTVSLSEITLLVNGAYYLHSATGPKLTLSLSQTCKDLLSKPALWRDTSHISSLLSYIHNDTIQLIEQPYAIPEDMRESLAAILGWPTEQLHSEESYKQALEDIAREEEKLRQQAFRREQEQRQQEEPQVFRRRSSGIKRAARQKMSRYLATDESLGASSNLGVIIEWLIEAILESPGEPFGFLVAGIEEVLEDSFSPAERAVIVSPKEGLDKEEIMSLLASLKSDIESALDRPDLRGRANFQLMRQRLPLPQGVKVHGKKPQETVFYTVVILRSGDEYLMPARPSLENRVTFRKGKPAPVFNISQLYYEKHGYALDVSWSNFELNKTLKLMGLDSGGIAEKEFLEGGGAENESLESYAVVDPQGIVHLIGPDIVDKVISETSPVIKAGMLYYKIMPNRVMALDPEMKPFVTIRGKAIRKFFCLYLHHILFYCAQFYFLPGDRDTRTFTMFVRGDLPPKTQKKGLLTRHICVDWLSDINAIRVKLLEQRDMMTIYIVPKDRKLPDNLSDKVRLAYKKDGFDFYTKSDFFNFEAHPIFMLAEAAARFQYKFINLITEGYNHPVERFPELGKMFDSKGKIIPPLKAEEETEAFDDDFTAAFKAGLAIEQSA